MEKRRMKTIGEQTGIMELDNVRQCGFHMYNLDDVVKVLNIDKCNLKSIIREFELVKYEDGWYLTLSQLKRILLRYDNKLTKTYLGCTVFNDNELQEYGIVIDDRFKEDNKDTELIKLINEYKQQEVDYDACKGNNCNDLLKDTIEDFRVIDDEDLDLIYKAIDEN